jgi:ABC-type multidrug transport system fused ATPase/permease subunit
MAKRRGAGPTNTDTDDLPKAKLSLHNLKKSARLFSYLGKHKWQFVLGMFFLIGSAGVGLVFPLKSGQMLGYLAENTKPVDQVRSELMNIGLVLLTILLIQAAFSF